jgi:uncharacterized protein (DUF362 family)
MPTLNRRRFLQTSALALGLAGCSRRPAPRAANPVSIAAVPDYDQRIYATVRELLAEHALDLRAKRVLLKPNLIEFEPDGPINTHPLLVHAALEAFRSLGAQVAIGEGPGHRRNTLDLAEAAGYFRAIPNFERLFTDLNLDDVAHVKLHQPHSRLDSVYLARSVLSCDLLVSMPKMKTHHWAGATLSMKNLFGTVSGGVYGWPKNVLHWAGIHQCVADLYRALPHHFALVDGIVGMQGNGPIQGLPKHSGVLVAGRDLAAVDATCCQLMRIDPRRIDYLQLATGGVPALLRSIRQIGEPVHQFASSFDLLPELSSLRLVQPV